MLNRDQRRSLRIVFDERLSSLPVPTDVFKFKSEIEAIIKRSREKREKKNVRD